MEEQEIRDLMLDLYNNNHNIIYNDNADDVCELFANGFINPQVGNPEIIIRDLSDQMELFEKILKNLTSNNIQKFDGKYIKQIYDSIDKFEKTIEYYTKGTRISYVNRLIDNKIPPEADLIINKLKKELDKKSTTFPSPQMSRTKQSSMGFDSEPNTSGYSESFLLPESEGHLSPPTSSMSHLQQGFLGEQNPKTKQQYDSPFANWD